MPTHFPHGLCKLNGGLQIYAPSRAMFERILDVLNTGTPDEFPFPDQDVLAKAFYGEWVPMYKISPKN
jgi:hypothetical protein